MNGKYFNMVVSSPSRREVIRTHIDTTIKKALDPILKKWGYRDISKVTPQLRYYELDLKPETMAGDTAGMEVFIKTSDSTDRVLEGFHPFVNKSSLKSFTQPYLKLDGYYLTRESSTGDGQLSLAVTFFQELRHFKINFCPQEGTYKIASKGFDNLHQLFSYYTGHPLKKTKDGEIFLLHPILKVNKVEDEPHEQASTPSLPYPGSDDHRPQPNVNGGNVKRPLPPPPVDAPPRDQKPHFPVSKNQQNSRQSPELPSENTKSTSHFIYRPLPELPPVSSDESSPPIVQKVNKPKNLPNKMHSSNSMKALNFPPDQPSPSYPDKPKNSLATPLSLSSLSSRGSPLSNNQNNNCDNSPAPPLLPRTEPRPSFKNTSSPTPHPTSSPNSHPTSSPTPHPTSSPINTNPGANSGKSRGLNKSNSFKVQGSNSSNNSPAPATPPDNLPQPWQKVYSNSQRKFYFYNTETDVTSWKHPLASKESFANSKQDSPMDKGPTNSVSSNDLSGPAPVRQRSQSSIAGIRPVRKTVSPNRSDLFTAGDVTEHLHSDSHKRDLHRGPPNHSESSPTINRKQIPACKPQHKETESPYDILSTLSPTSPSKQFSVQLKPIKKVNKQQNPPIGSGKFSEPLSSSPAPYKPSPIPNSAPTGRPVKSGRYTIPAPPPNMPPAFSVEKTPTTQICNSFKSKCMTLPNNSSNSCKNGLIDSIQSFKQNQLRSVTPDRRPPSPDVTDNNNVLSVLRRRLEKHREFIQDSDQSDSSYEDADW